VNDWRARLMGLGVEVHLDEPLAPRVAFRIGGPADAFVRPRAAEELAAVLALARAESVPLLVLGTGSNVLVSDDGVRGIVVRLTGALAEVEIDAEGLVHAGAGALNAPLVAKLHAAGRAGVEFLSTIPGTFGGALVMNAGAHGGEIGPFVREVELVDAGLHVVRRAGPECGFAYRSSGFAPEEILTRAVLEVPVGDVEAARARLAKWREHRRATQPIGQPNAGSIFKNPPGDYAGRLIEAAGLKGRRFGGACISELHANFIVNEGGARATDVLVLAAAAKAAVQERFGVILEWEVKRIGFGGDRFATADANAEQLISSLRDQRMRSLNFK